MLKKVGFVLVLLMALLQGGYALFAYFDPNAFANVRGTLLASAEDVDWVQIYASRTLFISILIGYLLYLKQYNVLIVAAVMGSVMPITDGWLAYDAGAPVKVVMKHVVTVAYLLFTALILRLLVTQDRERIASTS